MTEQWKAVVGHAGYEVSDLGRVRSYRPLSGRGPYVSVPRLLALRSVKGGKYQMVCLSVYGEVRTKVRPVHQLVLEAFVGPCPSGMEALHRDDNGTNNVLDNLRWGTRAENIEDKIANGKQIKGESHPLSKLTEAQIAEIRAAIPTWKRGMGRRFAEKFGVTETNVSYIKRGKTWKELA
jgi:hypothetical protein